MEKENGTRSILNDAQSSTDTYYYYIIIIFIPKDAMNEG